MKYFYPKLHTLHKPKMDYSDGLPAYKHLERQERVDAVLKGLLSAQICEVEYVEALAEAELREIHDDDYVDFLLQLSDEIEEDEEYIPSIFREDMSKSPLRFRGGMYCDEIGTPIGKGTINAARNSAKTALKGAEYILNEKKSAFVLTRPPGHHASASKYGGYCFFNNAYLCAKSLVNAGLNAAVIDVDYHIGDGSMSFATKDMPYYSLHAPAFSNYPYLDASFVNKNENVHLKELEDNMSGEAFLQAVEKLLLIALEKSPDVIVLSLGFDTLATDGLQDTPIKVQPENFTTLGEMFGSLKQEVLIVLEGGYDALGLELCAKNFMSGFLHKEAL